MNIRSQRKDDHVDLALKQNQFDNDFNLMKITHQSLPNISFDDIDTSIVLWGKTFSYPFYINAMSGGSDKTKETNRKLALIAKKFNLAMALGSQHAALKDESLIDSYKIVRETNPKGFIMGNVSANASLEEALKAVEMLRADALGIHINIAQEIAMDEGDRDFRNWETNIKEIVENCSVPVIVKEVGFGMSQLTVKKLKKMSAKNIDISGRGGTNFLWIENQRSETPRFDYLMDWGISPIESLLMNKNEHDNTIILASGGVKNPLDLMKLLVLGAKAVGISGMFLKFAQLPEEAMMEKVESFIHDFKLLMLLVSCKNVSQLQKLEYQLDGKLSAYYEEK